MTQDSSAPVAKRTAGDYLAVAVATCGVGYIPIAPGTWGSLFGVGLFLLLRSVVFWAFHGLVGFNLEMLDSASPVFLAVELAAITLITLTGIWAASRTERLLQRKDPGHIVIDEVAGQMIALLPVFARPDPSLAGLIAAFLFFRLFDIVKPYPARTLEKLESGLGVMADDLVAGAYAAVCVSLVVAMRGFV